jgi:hypothetical protein
VEKLRFKPGFWLQSPITYFLLPSKIKIKKPGIGGSYLHSSYSGGGNRRITVQGKNLAKPPSQSTSWAL